VRIAFSAPNGETLAILDRWQKGLWLQYSPVFQYAHGLHGMASKNLMIVSAFIFDSYSAKLSNWKRH
jgi:hypothetical protein